MSVVAMPTPNPIRVEIFIISPPALSLCDGAGEYSLRLRKIKDKKSLRGLRRVKYVTDTIYFTGGIGIYESSFMLLSNMKLSAFDLASAS